MKNEKRKMKKGKMEKSEEKCAMNNIIRRGER
jgi:hypothetical protein